MKLSLIGLALIPLSLTALADETATDSQVNPRVVAKAVEMGKHLRSLKKVAVTAQVTHDVVLESGHKIQAMGTSQMVAIGSNKLYLNQDTDNITREYFYDGKQLTQYSPPLQYYTTIDVPDTTGAMLKQVEKHYGLTMLFKALYQLGSEDAELSQLTLAAYVGSSKINGKVCDHLAFSQPGLDWQLWVSRDKQPLPCKLLVIQTKETGLPQTSQTYTWNLNPKVSASEFTFKPGKGDLAIPFKKIAD